MSAVFKVSAFLVLAAGAAGAYIYASPDGSFFSPASSPPQQTPAAHEDRAKADVDEELDFLAARRIASLEGWQGFLASHPGGPHAALAEAELREAESHEAELQEAEAQKRAQAQSGQTTAAPGVDEQPAAGGLGSVQPPTDQNQAAPKPTVAAAPAVDEDCKDDEDRLTRLRASPSPEGARRFADELRCEKLRPQVEALIGAPVAADPGPVGGASEAKPTNEEPPSPTAPATAVSMSPGDDVCKQEEGRLARLQTSPSVEAFADFLKGLRCEKLRPQVLAVMGDFSDSSKAQKAVEVSSGATEAANGATVASAGETDGASQPPKTPSAPASTSDSAAPAANVPRGGGQGVSAADAHVATSEEDACRSDGQRLEELRAHPTRDTVAAFAGELRCEMLRPQLSRLAESLADSPPPAPASALSFAPASSSSTPPAASSSTPPAVQASAQGPAPASACAADQNALNRVRMQPSPDAVQQLWRDLRCERLRPQVRLVLESLDLTADPSGACRLEAEELKRIRSRPDRREAEDFARDVKCDVLKPQAARLLESLSE